MTVKEIGPVLWKSFSEDAHMGVFGEERTKEMDRIDFALLAVSENNELVGYMTCRELDARTVYWQYGGAFDEHRETEKTWEMMQAFVRYHKDRYDRCTCYIENKNHKALRTAVKLGFFITGIKTFKNKIYLEHLLEFQGE